MSKLVRDLIPDIIRARGATPRTHTVTDPAQLQLRLREKLDEEVAEFHSDLNLEELADINEVLHGLAASLGHTPEQLEAVRAAKYAERGGFERGVMLDGIDE